MNWYYKISQRIRKLRERTGPSTIFPGDIVPKNYDARLQPKKRKKQVFRPSKHLLLKKPSPKWEPYIPDMGKMDWDKPILRYESASQHIAQIKDLSHDQTADTDILIQAGNWYQRLKYAQLQGEWWIQGGQAMFADGDVGDYNHEGMAIETAQQMIMDGEGDWQQWKRQVAGEHFREKIATLPQQQQVVALQSYDEEENLMEVLRQKGVEDATYAVAEGMGDVRKWAMQHLGWKRLQGVNVETWTATPADLKDIANGLWDAYQDEAETGEYNIYVYAQDKWYSDIPYANIEAGVFLGNAERGVEQTQKGVAYYQQQMMRPLDGD